MYKRSLAEIIKRFAEIYPVVGVTGPRQSGKTTLVKLLFPEKPYISFEDLDTRFLAQSDPREFLKQYRDGAIFDEVQQVPELLSYLQGVVDDSKQMGRFILTGSQNLSFGHIIAQSLAGRIGLVTLLPLSLEELGNQTESAESIFKGGYPRLYEQKMQPKEFYPSYFQTYIERDVRTLQNIDNLTLFQTFLKLCAGRVGQTINLSSLAQDCGISHTTARKWLSVLEASYIIFLLPPFYKNFSKRLIKMPKLYFFDTGLACFLLGLEKKEQVQTHYLKGALYENMVILEILKHRYNQALPGNLYFWKDQSGNEVDVIAEWGGIIKAIEIKSGATFQPEFVKNLEYFAKVASTDASVEKYLAYDGKQQGTFNGVTFVPFFQYALLFHPESGDKAQVLKV